MRFPALAAAGFGADPRYAAWYAEMLVLTEARSLPCAFSDGGDEAEHARVGLLATVGPPPHRPLPMPPPGIAPRGLSEGLRLLTHEADGRTVVVFDARINAEVLATVGVVPATGEPGGAHRYALRLHDGEAEPTVVVADRDGVVAPSGVRVVRDATHPADALFEEMARVVAPYAEGTEPVWARLRGTGFFPGGSGLWRRASAEGELPGMPYGKVMVIGQDYYSKQGYLELRRTGEELTTQTWRQLLRLFGEADVRPHDCFYTNAWMGLRSEGGVTGVYVGARDPGFSARCATFLERQIAVQRPRLVITLGNQVPSLLAGLAPGLECAWGSWPSLADIDARNAGLVRDVKFAGADGVTAHVVALSHPSFRHANVKHRRFTSGAGESLAGHAAEVALLREGLGAIGGDRSAQPGKRIQPPVTMLDVRSQIIAQYAEWTALSALRSGAPIKSRRDVYTALRRIHFTELFDAAVGPISAGKFDAWHAGAVADLIAGEPRLTVGWAAKILNVYLKTRCYVGSQGRPHLSDAIHPPIDAGLWLGLRRRFPDRLDILERSNCVERIKHIGEYACYERIIDGCRAAAGELGCKLIEVEQLWAGTEFEAATV